MKGDSKHRVCPNCRGSGLDFYTHVCGYCHGTGKVQIGEFKYYPEHRWF